MFNIRALNDLTVVLSERGFKAVLFDLDGTLIEFKFPVEESRHALLDFLKHSGFNVNQFNETMRTQDLVDGARLQWEKSNNLKSRPFNVVKANLYEILDGFEYKSMATARPFPNSLAVIEKIKQTGILVGIVTNSGRGPVQEILDKHGFRPYLNIVITRDEMERMKPSPDGLLKAQKLLDVETRDIIYVGDSVLDIESARSAQVKCASVPTGSHPADELRKLSPDYFLEELSDIEKLVIPNTS